MKGTLDSLSIVVLSRSHSLSHVAKVKIRPFYPRDFQGSQIYKDPGQRHGNMNLAN